VVRASDELAARLIVFFVPEVPLNEQILTFGVAVDALAIATELRVVGRQEAKASVHPVHKRLNLLFVAKDHPALPMRRHGTEIDDLDVTDGVDDFGGLRGWDLAHGAPLALRLLRKPSLQTGSGALFELLSLKGLTAVCEEYGNHRLVNKKAVRYQFVT
jgi:hypothetical protein